MKKLAKKSWICDTEEKEKRTQIGNAEKWRFYNKNISVKSGSIREESE